MHQVYVFISSGRFSSWEALCAYLDMTYTEDGDGVASAFAEEIGLVDYEPMCIEAIFNGSPAPVQELLDGASYGNQWIARLPAGLRADAAICVYPPNSVRTPGKCSLSYLGAFPFHV